MMMLKRFEIATFLCHLRSLLYLLLIMCISITARAVEWDAIEGKDITLFLPGQLSWEWMTSQNSHVGAAMVGNGRNCRMCHNNQEAALGNNIIKDSAQEPSPLPGAPASLTLNIKTTHDGERLYMHFNWKDTKAGEVKMDPNVQSRLSLLFNEGTVRETASSGCWASCHDDNLGMAGSGVTQTSKYLPQTRGTADLDTLRNNGTFLESWQVDLSQDNKPVAIDGYILDKRQHNQTSLLDAGAQLDNGVWTVTLNRPLVTADPLHKDIVKGKTYYLGFAIHANYSSGRYHYVSFGYSLALDSGNADFIVTQK